MEHIECPACTGEGCFIGGLGKLLWFRCMNCGYEFNITEEEAGE